MPRNAFGRSELLARLLLEISTFGITFSLPPPPIYGTVASWYVGLNAYAYASFSFLQGDIVPLQHHKTTIILSPSSNHIGFDLSKCVSLEEMGVGLVGKSAVARQGLLGLLASTATVLYVVA